MAFNFEEVKQAYERIRPYVRRTPLEESFYLNDGDRGGKKRVLQPFPPEITEAL